MIGITNIKTFRVNTKLYKDKKHLRDSVSAFPWSHQGLNLGPPDYESGATNQLSYRTGFAVWLGVVTEPHCKYNTFFYLSD